MAIYFEKSRFILQFEVSLPDDYTIAFTVNPEAAQVSFQWKNPDFLLKNPDFLLKNVDFII